MNIDFMLSEAWLQGMLGGAALALGRFMLSLLHLTQTRPEGKNRYGSLFAAHLVVGIIFALLGGAISWVVEGRASNFITGVTGMTLLSLLAGNLMTQHPVPEEATNA